MEVSGRRHTKTDGHGTGLLCDPCKGENEDEPAMAYCTVCNEYLCHCCRKAHSRATITKGHLLLDRASMPKQKPTSSNQNMCSKHKDKPLEYYCKNEDQFGCSVCATIEHKQCRVQYIDDIVSEYHKSNEYVALEKAKAELVRLLQETKGTATKNMNGITNIHANFISDLQQFRSEINNILDSLENEAVKEAKAERDTDQRTFNSIATACDSMLSNIQRITSELEALSKFKQKRRLVICSKMAMKTMNTYDKKVNELSNRNRVIDYKFQPNEEIRRFLHSLGDLGTMNKRKYVEQTQHGISTNTGADSIARTFRQPAASFVDNIDVRHSTDTLDSWITGGVVMDQTRLALVDFNNSSVKIADLDGNTVTSCIKLPTRPCDITCVNQDQIVVTCDGRKKGKLVFLNVGESLSVVKELNIDRQCQGVVYTNGTFLVTFINQESSVKAIDMNGNVLKTFKTNTDGGALFSNAGHICLSTDQKIVFVSEIDRGTVTSLTLDGTVQHVYTADGLKQSRGLAVDRNDNVYIARCLSHNIHQLSTDGNQSQVMLDKTDGMKYPYMMAYCKIRHRLYISVQKGSYYEVRVFQLH